MSTPRSTSPALPGSLSVREICELDLFANTRLLAGAGGLDRRVQRLNVMTIPDVERWTKHNELLLTTGYPLPDASAELVRLFTRLDGSGVVALGIKHGVYGPHLTPEVLRAADDLRLPVIDIPEALAFDDILSNVLSEIANRQAAVLSRAQEIHRALLHIVLEGGALADIARELSGVLGGAGVICVDPAGHVLAKAAGNEHWKSLAHHGLLGPEGTEDTIAVDRLATTLTTAVAGQARLLAVPMLAGSLRHGHLLVVATDSALPPEAEVLVQQSAMVATLDITRRMAVSAVERHFESSAIHDLLAGGDHDIADVMSRATSFGWDLDRPLMVLVSRREPTHAASAKPAEPHHSRLPGAYDVDAWVRAVRGVDRAAAVGSIGRDLVAVCGAGPDDRRTARAVAREFERSSRRRRIIGVSEVLDDASALPTGYQHARLAAEIAGKVGDGDIMDAAVTRYQELGLLRLLNAVSDAAELQTFVDETLGRVLAQQPEERAELLRTLDVLLEESLNVAQAARELHVHYNTLRHRIQKLRRLVGPFTDDGQLRLRLAVSLRILHMWELSGRP